MDQQIVQSQIDGFMNNCLTKTTLTTVAGGAMGMLFGMFFGANSVTMYGTIPEPGVKIPLKTQMIAHYKDMIRSGTSMGRNFAVVGGMFSVTECLIEKSRGTSDHYNGLFSGFLTGGLLAYKGGLGAMASGAALFAAFSFVVDHFFQEKDPRVSMLPYDPEIDHIEELSSLVIDPIVSSRLLSET